MAAVPSRAILVEASDEHAEAAEIRVEAILDANEGYLNDNNIDIQTSKVASNAHCNEHTQLTKASDCNND